MIPDPRDRPVLGAEEARAAWGNKVGRSAWYEAIRRGDIPSIRVGRRVLIPTAQLRKLAGEGFADSAERQF